MFIIKDTNNKKTQLTESKKSQHIFENGEITFGNIRDVLTKAFCGDILMSSKVPGMSLLVTYKDGDFGIATDLKKLSKPCSCLKLNCCDEVAEIKEAFKNSVNDLIDALQELDPVLLNKYFANGQNFLDCQFIYPPADRCSDYCNKCFMTLNKIKCYDKNFKEIGEDTESAEKLFNTLRNHGALCHEMTEIALPKIAALKGCANSKVVLAKILEKLNEFINGVGWGCSIDSYIQDKYSRHIINKALEHNLDVSRNSPFVHELVSRLSGTSVRPTKSDLVTFAKREGLDCKSDDYKSFLSDIESNSAEIGKEIIQPIENLLYYAIIMAAKNIIGYMTADPSSATRKLMDNIDCSCFSLNDQGEAEFSVDKIDSLKKNLSRLDQYASTMPKNIIIMYKQKPYSLTSTVGRLKDLCDIIKFN